MRYDTVIVGGGHNGLTAGCYLARAGLSTIVLEKEQRIGGMALSAPLIDSAPAHLVSPCAFEDLFFRIGGVATDLDLAHYGFREHESDGWCWLGPAGESLLVQRDVAATIADIANFSRSDARRYRELMAVAFRCVDLFYGYLTSHPTRPGWRRLARWAASLARDRRLRRALADMCVSSAVDVITATFESAPVRALFANTILGSPFADGSGITLMNTSLLHRSGIGRPVGGMGGIVAALERFLNAHHGVVRTDARVVAISVQGGRATAVQLDDGSEIHASRAVLAACPPQLVAELAGDALGREMEVRLQRAPDDAWGIGQMTVTLALAGQVALPAHQPARPGLDLRRPTLMTGTLESLLDAAAAAMRGRFVAEAPWWAAILTAVDPTQAPAGQDVVDLYLPAVPSTPQAGWSSHRDQIAARIVERACAVLDGVRERELGRYIETPADRAARVGTGRGSLYHVDFLPTRVGPLRPAPGLGGYRTPIAGLYLAGIGTHPPAGVSGLNGKLAAKAVLEDLARGHRAMRTIR